ncbi:MAG: hypothetical protein RBS56_01880 [Candidatus Gracilibacteria bacterium]|jgi:hypothetical protein|nr:hypothetical protein [Candidatus Gracilibacteria bacterium]
MKKPILLLLLVPFLFSCSLFGPIDDVEVHNQLVARLDNLKESENGFYKAYISLRPDDSVNMIEEKFSNFNLAVVAVDDFFDSTRFASYQEVFVDSYEEFYKDFVAAYSKLSGDFVSELKSSGVTFDVINKYSFDLDQYSINFVDFHNRLIDIINQQADEK